jgi:RHS repeat-associated protein
MRAVKYVISGGVQSETLYFNRMVQVTPIGNREVESRHIYVGEVRIATKRRTVTNNEYSEEQEKQYYYHGDHLGSAELVTDGKGEIYEHLEYTPYGELWVDHAVSGVGDNGTPFRFTGKEMDAETGLYYYGARYLDPRTGRWLSVDPAMGEYIPLAPISDNARKYNGSLPGMGGIFNIVNLHVYHYAGNNPVVMVDPDGESQTEGQKRYTEGLARRAGTLTTPEAIAQFKSNFSIVISRTYQDNGENGSYYQSTLSVMYNGVALNSIAVQSTADEPAGPPPGKTLPSGQYTGTLMGQSGKFLRPIHLSDGTNAMEMPIDYYEFHPNEITNTTHTSYGSGPTSRPLSAGCQVANLADFNEVMDILKAMGFRPEDTIDVIIMPPRHGYYDYNY